MERPASIHWRASLITRLAYLSALLTAGVVALFGFLTYQGSRDQVIAASREGMQHDAESVALKLQATVTSVVRDIVYLARTHAVREFARTQGAGGRRIDTRRRKSANSSEFRDAKFLLLHQLGDFIEPCGAGGDEVRLTQ